MPFRRFSHFPKQLFFRFLRQQVLGVVPVLLVAAIGARLYLESRLTNLQTMQDVVSAYDRAFLFLALVMALSVTGISLWTGYRLVLPLGRILVKARSILRREYQSPREDESSLVENEQGEWSDLESALHRIGKDMRNKDISLSREREEIEAIISAIAEAVVAVDRDGNLLFFNSQFALFFGKPGRRQSRIPEFFRNPDILDAFRTTLREGAPASASAQLQLRTETMHRHFSLSVAPLKLGDGQLYGAVGVFHDVTELKRMDQVRIDFVANVSHELRTPLTSIKGYAQTVKEELAPGSQARSFLDTIERNADRLIALVQDLLSLSALESGEGLAREAIDLAELTGRVVNQLEALRLQKEHRLELTIESTELWAEPKRVEQVVFNLLENAIKYVPPRGEIKLRWSREENETLLSVIDNGPGIPVEHHSRIFERFYRVDGARNREQGGTGLGLSIVKHIVQRHGGKVRIRGGLGEGSEFLCSFPDQEH
jgi:two-component system, OmpR family, phosphate regulon sensor histidine kinase PhoR